MARVASRLCFCRVVLRYAVERKLRGTHRPCYVKSSRDATNASGLCLSIHRTALSALARSESPVTAEPTLSAGPPLPDWGVHVDPREGSDVAERVGWRHEYVSQKTPCSEKLRLGAAAKCFWTCDHPPREARKKFGVLGPFWSKSLKKIGFESRNPAERAGARGR